MSVSKVPLGQMLEILRDMDEDLLPKDFDPQALIGDIRNKADGIKWRINAWEYRVKMIKEEGIDLLEKKIKAINGKADKLREYVLSEMTRLGVEKVPGNLFQIQRVANSTAKLTITQPPDENMIRSYPELIRQETRWDTDKVKEHLMMGERFTFASIERGFHVRFPARGEE